MHIYNVLTYKHYSSFLEIRIRFSKFKPCKKWKKNCDFVVAVEDLINY